MSVIPGRHLIRLKAYLVNVFTTITASVVLVCVFLLPSFVQAAPPTPGTVISPIDKPVIKPDRSKSPQITRKKKSAPSTSGSAVTVKVNAFTFKGNTSFSDEVLKEVAAPYAGKQLSIPDIYFVADVVESYYRYHGYLLTSVYVPAQKINSGTIILEVIEGRLGEIKIDGKLESYTEAFLTQQIDQLQSGNIIDDKALESETLLLGDLPGLEARAVISPGKEYGTSDVTFIPEEDRYSTVINVNNYGRKSIGENRIEAGFLMANPITQGDMLNLSAIAAESSRMFYLRADYDALVNTSGTRVGLSYSAFDYDVDVVEAGLTAGLTLEGSGSSIIIRGSHPIVRTSRNNTTVLINARRSSTEEEGTAATRPDTDITLLEAFIIWDHLYSDFARTSIQGGLVTNFKSRKDILDDDAQKARLSVDVNHYQPFMDTWYFNGRVQAVYAPDPLVDVERFRIGGPGSVRAFPSAEVAGDQGGVISLDVGKSFVVSKTTVLTPRAFIDAGKVYRHDDFGLFGLADEESLSGYGVGLTAAFVPGHTLDIEVVTPSTNRVGSDGDDTRFWLNYRGQF